MQREDAPPSRGQDIVDSNMTTEYAWVYESVREGVWVDGILSGG